MIKKDDYELYFLNDSYDDEIISDKICSFRNRLYYDVLSGKKYIQNNTLINGNLENVRIDPNLNLKYGLPADTYSVHLNIPVLEYFSTDALISKYKYDTPISLSTIMKDNDVFTKNIFFYIGEYFVSNAYIVIEYTCDRSIIFIPNGNLIKELVNGTDKIWTLNIVEKSDIYYGYASRASLIKGNKIYLSGLSQISKFNKPSPSNSWTIYISYSNKYLNTLVSSYVSMDNDENGYYFSLRDEFVDFIYQNATTMKCYVVNNPSCIGNGVYINSKESNPIFRIPYKKNPIPLENVVVWAFDSETQRKLYPMVTDAELSYPDIYNFTNMLSDKYNDQLYKNTNKLIAKSDSKSSPLSSNNENATHDLYIEWIEPVDDISAFDTYIDDYISCYNDEYVSMVENDTVHPLVKNYKPVNNIDFSPMEYFESEYKGDYRAWRIEKLIELLKDNPSRYEELFRKIYLNIRKMVSRSYTYNSDPHIYDRSIMDNAEHCDSSDENFVKFKEPQAFIRIYNSTCKKNGCNLYINGVLRNITKIMNYGSTLYIYFPASYIKNKEDIHLDMYLDDRPIDSQWFYLYRSTDSFDLENYPFKEKNSLSNLLFVNKDTNEYIDKDKFKIQLQILINDIKYIGLDKVDTISSIDTDVELWEKLMSLVVPTDSDVIILKTTEVLHDVENASSQKKINLNNISLYVKDNSLDDKKLQISTTNFRTRKYIKADNTDEIVLNNFIGKPDASRFNIFKNGLLINPATYTTEFTNYNGDVVFKFTDIITGDIYIEYVGFDRELIYAGKYSDLNNMNDGILYLDDFLDTPFDDSIYQIYIDGKRVHHNNIHFISQHSMIKINESLSCNDNSDLIILKQKTDSDPYEYDTQLEFLSDVSKEDAKFRKYLLDTYDK